MEKLSKLHVPPEWEAALIACLDKPPRRPRDRRLRRMAILLAFIGLAGLAGVVAWFGR